MCVSVPGSMQWYPEPKQNLFLMHLPCFPLLSSPVGWWDRRQMWHHRFELWASGRSSKILTEWLNARSLTGWGCVINKLTKTKDSDCAVIFAASTSQQLINYPEGGSFSHAGLLQDWSLHVKLGAVLHQLLPAAFSSSALPDTYYHPEMICLWVMRRCGGTPCLFRLDQFSSSEEINKFLQL